MPHYGANNFYSSADELMLSALYCFGYLSEDIPPATSMVKGWKHAGFFLHRRVLTLDSFGSTEPPVTATGVTPGGC